MSGKFKRISVEVIALVFIFSFPLKAQKAPPLIKEYPPTPKYVPPQEEKVEVKVVKGLVTLNLENALLSKVLQLITQKTGKKLIPGPGLEEVRISVYLPNVSLEEGMKAITEAYGLELQRVEGTAIWVVRKKLIPPSPVVVDTVFLTKAKAKDLVEVVSSLLSSEGRVSADERTNSLIIKDVKEIVEEIKKIVKVLDERPPREEKFPFEIKTIPLAHAQAKEIEPLLSPLLSEEGRIMVNEETNSLVIKDKKENIKRMEKLIKKVDVRPSQILIKAEMVEVSLDALEELGSRWSWIAGGEGATFETQYYAEPLPEGITVNPGPSTSLEGGSIIFGVSPTRDIRGVINMLISEQKAKLLSNPKVVTVEGKEAKIETKEKIPYQIVTITEAGLPVVSYEFAEVGVTLAVTPHLRGDGGILLELNPKVSEITKPATSEQVPPTVGERETKTEVLVKNGETVIIGGLLKENKKILKRGVPFLSSLPLLGALFSYSQTTTTKNDLLVMVTPYLLPEKIERKDTLKKMEPEKREIEKIYEEGEAFLKEKNYQEAEKRFGEVIEKSKDYLYLKEYTLEAEKGLEEIKKLRKKAQDLLKKGEKLYQRGKFEAARTYFTEALKVDPSLSSAQEWLRRTEGAKTKILNLYEEGKRLYRQEKYLEASKKFKEILELDPEHSGARWWLKLSEAKIK